MAVRHGAFDEIRRRRAAGETVRETRCRLDRRALRRARPGDRPRRHRRLRPHAGDPHYAPGAGDDRALADGDVVLIDLWAKEDRPDAPFADVTWMGVCGEPSPEVARAWAAVRDGRDLAIRVIAERYAAGDPPAGWEVDRAVRDHLTAAGYGDAFVHRTGHSLGTARSTARPPTSTTSRPTTSGGSRRASASPSSRASTCRPSGSAAS